MILLYLFTLELRNTWHICKKRVEITNFMWSYKINLLYQEKTAVAEKKEFV